MEGLAYFLFGWTEIEKRKRGRGPFLGIGIDNI